jgi:hypothetical protein
MDHLHLAFNFPSPQPFPPWYGVRIFFLLDNDFIFIFTWHWSKNLWKRKVSN